MRVKLNKKGMTLIELVVVMAVLGLVLSGVTIIIGFASNFFSEEDSSIIRQENLRLVTVNFEKDVRKSNQDVSENSGCVLVGTINYCLSDNDITRNGLKIAEEIATFDVSLASDDSYLDLLVVTTPDERGNTAQAETRIYLRKGD